MSKFKQKISTWELEPSTGGCFELTVDGELLYSKLSTGEFPEEDPLVEEIGRRA